MSGMDDLGKAVASGKIDFGTAHDMLFRAHERLFGLPSERRAVEALKERLTNQIVDHAIGPRAEDDALMQRLAKGVANRQIEFEVAVEIVVENVMHHVHETEAEKKDEGVYWSKDQKRWIDPKEEYRSVVLTAVDARMQVLVNRAVGLAIEERERHKGQSQGQNQNREEKDLSLSRTGIEM